MKKEDFVCIYCHKPYTEDYVHDFCEPESIKNPPTRNVMEEANDIVNGDRQESYGHPLHNHSVTAAMMSFFLTRKYSKQVLLDAEDICWFNVFQKISREANMAKRDNLVDVIGYVANIEMIREKKMEEHEKAKDES